MDGRQPGSLAHSPPVPWLAALFLALVGAMAMVTVHPLAPIAVAMVLAIVAIGVTQPMYITCAFIGVLFLRPAEIFPQLAPLQLGKVVALAALGMFFTQRMLARDASWARLPQNRWLIWLALAVMASALLGSDPAASMEGIKQVFVKILLLWLLIVNLVENKTRAKQMQVWLGVLALALATFALQSMTSGKTVMVAGRLAAVGLLGDPNDLALTLLVGAPFLFAAAINTRGFARFAFTLMLLPIISVIGYTQSRGGLLGLVLGMGIVLLGRVKTKRGKMVVAGIAAAGLVVGMAAVKRPDLSQGDGLDQSAEHRLAAWTAGVTMLKKHPVLGVGYDRFPENFVQYATTLTDRPLMAAHNTFVKCFAETGLAGFIPFMALVLLGFRAGLRSWKRARELPPSLERAVLESQLANQSAVMVSAFFLSQTWLWFIYIVLAMSGSVDRVWTMAENDPSPVTDHIRD